MSNYKEFISLLSIMFLLSLSIFFIDSHLETVMSDSFSDKENSFTVVIDAGHGGFDSGKVGILGTLEKDVNLQIAKKLAAILKAADVKVIMTRTEDLGLYDENSSNKKRQDMSARAALMNEASPDCVVSIHQNSYPEEYVHGAQVFYYEGSSKGQYLADCLQNRLIVQVDPENKRQIKANDSYYLLKKTGVPIVIAECGFLSNGAEAEKLCTEEYQERVAWALYIGIMQYLNTVD